MEYLGTEHFLEQRGNHSPAYTWTNSAETFSSSYRINEMSPSATFQQWTFPHHLDPCTAAPDASMTPSYELPLDSSSPFSPAMIDATRSFLVTPAVEEQKPLLPDIDDPATSRPRRTAGRIPRKPYPIIVPNLTKKARGRQVPTKDTLLQSGSGRVFACQVESCRKVFTRSEHLKRHTRSIHTHEKPFRCEEPSCGRLFTRHDNLLQHLKNNRHLSTYSDADCGPLERVRPSAQHLDSPHGDSMPLSPSMGVLLPPSSPTTSLTYNQLPMNDLDIASSFEAASPASCDDSPECTPAPSETPYAQFDRGYTWQSEVADIYSAPQYEYTAPQYAGHPQVIASAGIPLGMYGYHS